MSLLLVKPCSTCSIHMGEIKQNAEEKVKKVQDEFNTKLNEINRIINEHLKNFVTDLFTDLKTEEYGPAAAVVEQPKIKSFPVPQEFVDIKRETLELSDNDSQTNDALSDAVPQPPVNLILEHSIITTPLIELQTAAIATTFPCGECPKIFKTTSGLRKHKKLPHSATKTGKDFYICDVCPKMFADKHIFKTHHRSHMADSFLHCDICSKSFTLKQSLVVHMRTHTDERPYMCHLCCRSFKQSAPFRRHMRTHKEDKPYPCTLCDKKFREEPHLRVHMQSHTGERPHACPLCKKGFSKRYHARKHILNFHKRLDVDEIFPSKKRRTNNTIL